MMTNSNKLFRWRDPYDTAGTEGLFAAAMGGERRISGGGLPGLRPHPPPVRPGPRAFWQTCGVPRRPAAPCPRCTASATPSAPCRRGSSSSGPPPPAPAGVMSRVGLDAGTLGRGLSMSVRVARYHRLLSPTPLPLLHFGLPAPVGATTPPSARPALPSPSLPRPSAGPMPWCGGRGATG